MGAIIKFGVWLGTTVFMDTAIGSLVRTPNGVVVKTLYRVGAACVSGFVATKVAEDAAKKFVEYNEKLKKEKESKKDEA